MFETKHVTTGATLKTEGDEAGRIAAVISTFDVVDHGGDVVLASAFTDGQEALMTWGHDWARPIGKGLIRVEPGRAVFDGRLWLDTVDGEQAYRKIRNAGDLQEYSWGFRILDADFAERDGQEVRVITRTEFFEASPVLKGEGLGTRTLALKSGLSFADQSAAVLAAARDWADRAGSLADLRQKEGRVLSEANRERLKAHADALAAIEGDLRALHAATAPAPKDDGKAATLAVVWSAQRTLARLNGVAV
jgi:HK97 family phage prohead protease